MAARKHRPDDPDSSGRARPKRGAGGRRRPPERAVWLYGVHAVRAALANPARRTLRLLATEAAAAALGAAGARAEIVPRPAIDAVVRAGAVHQGLALQTMPLEPPALARVLAEAPAGGAVLVVLDQLTDPHNTGAILRSAAAFGACAVVATTRHAAAETGALAKAAAGALELVPLIAVPNLARALDQIAEAEFWVLGLDAGAARTLDQAAPPARVAIVLGAEGGGLRRLTRERCDELVRLPMSPAVNSLNVSNAAAIALWELTRRLRPA